VVKRLVFCASRAKRKFKIKLFSGFFGGERRGPKTKIPFGMGNQVERILPVSVLHLYQFAVAEKFEVDAVYRSKIAAAEQPSGNCRYIEHWFADSGILIGYGGIMIKVWALVVAYPSDSFVNKRCNVGVCLVPLRCLHMNPGRSPVGNHIKRSNPV